MEAFTHIVTPVDYEYGGVTYIKIDWDGTRLSVTGVEGPKRNGDAFGGCGQIREFDGELRPGWTREMVERLRLLWNVWHLNDMKAGCEHQRAAGWDERPIDPSKPLNSYGKHFEGQHYASWNMLTWVKPSEHPDGLMTVPCPECGYKYGTAWLTMEVPDEVLNELKAFPAATTTPAWV